MVKKKRQTDVFYDCSSSDSSEDKTMLNAGATQYCQHIKKSVDTTRLRKALKSCGIMNDCGQCNNKNNNDILLNELNNNSNANNNDNNYEHENSAQKAMDEDNAINNLMDDSLMGYEHDTTLWICLKCGTQLCGRSRNQHALQHFKTPHSDSHALAMNTQTFVIWCYECDNEVKLESRKNLYECVDIVKRIGQKPLPLTHGANYPQTEKPTSVENIEKKIIATWETIRPLVSKDTEMVNHNNNNNNSMGPLAPPLPIPGVAKRVETALNRSTNETGFMPLIPVPNMLPTLDNGCRDAVNFFKNAHSLPRVRGLTNLGNTCFFNAVLQCLAQTPYLLDVLKESAEPGEEFILPGGTFKFKENDDVELPMIKGTLPSWGALTAALAHSLEELQSGGGVFCPNKLFDKLCTKCPQFRGGDQHDSHELLRQLLEGVRSEDLKRYQRVILQDLGYKGPDSESDEMRQKCKVYGNQAADRILRPDQVFRGFLVSTLTCQTCYNVSSRHEYFLDLSLPVAVEKPQLPQRRRPSPDNTPSSSTSFFLDPMQGLGTLGTQAEPALNKSQARKEKKSARKAQKAAAKRETAKLAQARRADGTAADDNVLSTGEDCMLAGDVSSGSSYEQSDADVEDNLMEDTASDTRTRIRTAGSAIGPLDNNSNRSMPSLSSPGSVEKRGDSPENMDKDSLDEDANGIATSPAYAEVTNHNLPAAETTNGVASAPINNSILSLGLSGKGANLVRTLSSGGGEQLTLGGGQTPSNGYEHEHDTQAHLGEGETTNLAERLAVDLQLKQTYEQQKQARAKRQRTHSYSDWSTTIAPRMHCEDGECSVQSCLNNFTGVELMSGSNKVGCDTCTKHMSMTNNKNNMNNDNDDEASGGTKQKTVYTNATKQFLISSPPAVLILHLKRFQLGPRCIFRKLTRGVSYPMVLDIAPFCGSKVKNLPNIDRKQKKLLYALYGIVEHAGSMYGGHYTAYVKVRPQLAADDKRWKFIPQGSKAELDQDDEQRKKLEELLVKEKARDLRMKATNDSDDFTTSESASGNTSTPASSEESDGMSESHEGAYGAKDRENADDDNHDSEASNVQVPPGKWYYVSDSHVKEVTEESALDAQAYLLFYERIY